jgi:outer membrane protein OmpA-like peptidoglycan-associated protein
MKRRENVFVVCILFWFLAGCGPNQDLIVPPPQTQDLTILPPANRDLIILLPDPDGNVGTIQVMTEGGSQTLEKAGYGTQVEDFNKLPTAPKPVDENEIATVFGSALSGQPDLTGRFVSFILYCESDTAKLTDESKKLLPEIVRNIKNRKSKEVYVVGHTDRIGTAVYNMGLSARRANYVRDQLLFAGVQSSTLVISFHGEGMLLVDTADEIAEPLNRRVEVFAR